MKKILTVSLFAIMAVGAANADIASTSYVDTRTGDTTKINKIGSNTAVPASLTEAVNQLNQNIADEISTMTSGVDGQLSGLTNQFNTYKTSNDAAVAAAKAQADQGVEDAAAAQAAADANAEAIAGLDGSYVSEDEMTAFKTSNTGAIAAAKDQAVAAAADAAKIYIDADELEASQTAQDAILKKYADDAAAAVGTTASGALSTALADYSTTTQMNSAIATAKSEAATDAQSKADAAEAAAIAASDSKGSAAQALTDAKAFTTQEINALSALAKFPTACAQGVSHCSLTIKDGDLTWEIVQ